MTTYQTNTQPIEDERAKRNKRAFRLLLVIGIIIFVASTSIVFRLLQESGFTYRNDLPQSGAGVITGLLFIGASFIAKRGYVTVAIAIATFVFFAVDIFLITELTDIGLPLTITITVTMILIASQTLPQRYIVSSIIIIFSVGSMLILLDLFWVGERSGIDLTDLRIVYIAAVSIILVALFIAYRRFPTFSLRTKLVGVAVVLVILTVFLTTILVNAIARDSLTEQLNQKFGLIGESGTLAITDLLSRQVNIVESIAIDSGLRTKAIIQNNQYEADESANLTRILERDEQWISGGPESLKNFITNNPTAVTLRQLQSLFPGHVEIFVTDKYGALVGATNVTSDYYQGDEAWWQRAYNDGQGGVYIGEPAYDESSAIVGIDIALPIFDGERNDFVGVVRTTYDINQLQGFLEAGEFGETGHLDLITNDLILRGTGDRISVEELLYNEDMLTRIQASRESRIENVEGRQSLVNSFPIDTSGDVPALDALNWTVVLSQTEQEAFAAVHRQEQLSVILALIAIVLGAVLAAYAAKVIANPINRLTDTAVIIAEGNLNRRASVETQDEIGTLALAFNRMTDQLRNFIGSLEGQVAERTQALATSTEVSRQLSTILNMDELVYEVVNQVRNSFGYYHTQIYLYDEDQKYLVMAGGTGNSGQKMLADGHKLMKGQGLVGRAAATNEVILIPDVTQDSSWLAHPLLTETASETAIPIALGDEVIGVLDVQHNVVHGLNEESVELLQSIANQVAIAIQNIRQYEQTQNALAESDRLYNYTGAQAARLAALNEMSGAFTNAANEEEIYSILGENILNVINGDRASLVLIDHQKQEWEIILLGGEGHQIDAKPAPFSALAGTAVGQVMNKERLLRLPLNASMSDYSDSRKFMEAGFQSLMLVPLKAGGKIVGTLNVGSKKNDAFNEEETSFIEQIANTIATHIEGQRLSTQASLLASIVENHPDFIGVGSLEGDALYVNPSGLQMMNYPLDTNVTELSARSFYSEEDADLLLNLGIPMALEMGSWTFEVDLYRSDGTTIPVEETIGINYDSDNKPVSFSITMRDIRERKESERTLRAAQTRNEAILQSIVMPMFIANVQTGQILYANQYFADLLRIPLEDLTGKEAPNYYQNSEERQVVIETIETEGGIFDYELALMRNDQTSFYAMLTAQMFDFAGEKAIITALTDISDRIAAQNEIAKQATELATVAEVSTAVATTLDTQTLFKEVVDLTKTRFELYHAHIYLLSEDGSTLRLVAGAGEAGDKMVAEGRTIGINQPQSLVALAARERRGVVANDVRAEAGFLPNPLLPDTRAELATPMIIGEQLLGVLDIQADKVDYFAQSDVDIQTTLVSQIAAAIQNATQFQRAQEALEEVTRMQKMLVREGWESFMDDQDFAVQGYHYDQQQIQPIKKNGSDKNVVVPETDEEDTAVYSPLTVRGASIGTLGVRDPSGKPVSADKRQLLESISLQVAEALERARLFQQTESARYQTESALEETRRRTEELAVINKIVTDLGASLDVNESMKIVVDGIVESMDVDQCRIALMNEDGQSLTIVAEHFDMEKSTSALGLHIPIVGNALTQEVLKTQKPVVINDVDTNPLVDPVRELLEEQGITGLIVLPMIVGNEVLGTVGIDLLREDQTFTNEQLGLAQTIIFQAATAVQNARLYTQTQNRAERERLVNTINQKIQSTTSVESALQTAIEELGRALKAQNTRVNLQLNKSEKNGSK